MKLQLSLSLLCLLTACTYDATPPSDAQIHDERPVLMLDLRDCASMRKVQIQFTDVTNTSTTISNIRTDNEGRLLQPVEMAHLTRSYSLTILVDQSGDDQFIISTLDKKYN